MVYGCEAWFGIEQILYPEDAEFFAWLEVNGESRVEVRARLEVQVLDDISQCPPPKQPGLLCTPLTEAPGNRANSLRLSPD